MPKNKKKAANKRRMKRRRQQRRDHDMMGGADDDDSGGGSDFSHDSVLIQVGITSAPAMVMVESPNTERNMLTAATHQSSSSNRRRHPRQRLTCKLCGF